MAQQPRRGGSDSHAWLYAATLLVIVYILATAYAVVFTRSHVDEGNYVMKSWWFVTGAITPYGPEDNAWYLPVTYYFFGLWQLVAGVGHISARIGNALLGGCTIAACYVMNRRILGFSRLASLIPLALFCATPIAILDFTVVGPYTLVTAFTLLSMAMIWTQRPANPYRYGALFGVLQYLLYFTRPNLFPGIALLCIWMFALAPDRRWTRLGIAAASFAGATAATLAIFPRKLAYIAYQLPIITPAITEFLEKRGLYRDPYGDLWRSSADNWTVPGASFGWWTDVSHLEYFFWREYKAVALLCAVALIIVIAQMVLTRRVAPLADLGVLSCIYFLGISAVHMLGSFLVAPANITPYTMYAFVIGLIGTGWACVQMARWATKEDASVVSSIVVLSVCLGGFFWFVPRKQLFVEVFLLLLALFSVLRFWRWTRARLLLPLMIASFVSWIAIAAAPMVKEDFEFYESPRDRPYITQLHEVAQFVRERVPSGTRMLVIGGQPYTTEAVFLAGSVPNASAIYQGATGRAFKPGVTPEQRARALQQANELGYWTDEILLQWITGEAGHYEYLLTNTGPAFMSHFDDIQKHFNRIGVMNEEIVVLYRRKVNDTPR